MGVYVRVGKDYLEKTKGRIRSMRYAESFLAQVCSYHIHTQFCIYHIAQVGEPKVPKQQKNNSSNLESGLKVAGEYTLGMGGPNTQTGN